MDVSDLKVFEAVARLGSMNRAALELNTVQSNVTAKIRNLELELGVQLFQRQARGVQLTPAGRRLLPFSPKLSKLLSDAKTAALDDGSPNGELEIGTLETTAALRLPTVLANFARTYPLVRLVVTTGTTCSLVSDVLGCRLDSAFVAGPIGHPDLLHTPVFREELVLVAPRSLRSLEDLGFLQNLQTIVFRIGCSYRLRLDTFLASRGFLVTQPLEFGSVDAILGCIAAGVGISLLPKGVVASAWRDGRVSIHELAPEDAIVETELIRRRDTYVSSAMSAFLNCLTSERFPTLQAAE
ncbi:DNA-binding transcriptional LysR family regulator [Bradyrhizobium elkanii]